MTSDQLRYEPGDEGCIDEVHITRASDQDLLREFRADIQLFDGLSEDKVIGSINGLIGWRIGSALVWDAADAVSASAEVLGDAADQIIEWLEIEGGSYIDTIVMIQLIRLDPPFRGHRLTRGIIRELVEVLSLLPAATLIVLQPEPQWDEGGDMPAGPEHDYALAHLRRGYEEQGLQRWRDSLVWWMLAAE